MSGVEIGRIFEAAEADEAAEGVWVPFKDGVEVRMRYLAPKRMRALMKKAQRKSEFVDGRIQKVVDEDYLSDLIAKEVAVDWRGINMDGTAWPFSTENLKRVMDAWTEFARFMNQACLDIRNFVEEKEEEARGN